MQYMQLIIYKLNWYWVRNWTKPAPHSIFPHYERGNSQQVVLLSGLVLPFPPLFAVIVNLIILLNIYHN